MTREETAYVNEIKERFIHDVEELLSQLAYVQKDGFEIYDGASEDIARIDEDLEVLLGESYDWR